MSGLIALLSFDLGILAEYAKCAILILFLIIGRIGLGVLPPWSAAKLFNAILFLVFATTVFLLNRYGGAQIQFPAITDVACDLFVYRFYIVYKIGLAMAAFHSLLALSLAGVRSNSQDRSVIQDAFWPVKILLLISLIIGFLWLPRFLLDYLYYPTVVISLAFSFMQAVILINLAYGATGYCLDHGGVYMGLLVAASCILSAFIGFGTYGMFVTFTGSIQRTLIIANAIIAAILAALSVIPLVRKGNERSGLFQAVVLGSLSFILISSSIASSPESRLEAQSNNIVQILTYLSDAISAVFCISTVLTMVYVGGSSKNDDEDHQYNYSLFHLVFIGAVFYTVALVTGWLKPEVNGGSLFFGVNQFASVAKHITAGLLYLLYLWTLFAPVLFPDREFDF